LTNVGRINRHVSEEGKRHREADKDVRNKEDRRCKNVGRNVTEVTDKHKGKDDKE
jgi:hypothetical protein